MNHLTRILHSINCGDVQSHRFVVALRVSWVRLTAALFAFFVLPAAAFQPPAQAALPNFDQRIAAAAVTRASPEQTQAAGLLRGGASQN